MIPEPPYTTAAMRQGDEMQSTMMKLREQSERARNGDPIAKDLADQVVQSIADSEPDDLTILAQAALEGTAAAHLYVLEGETIRKAVYAAISDAFFDGVLATPETPGANDG